MNTSKTFFAQLMDFLPWRTFSPIVVRYDGDRRKQTSNRGEQYRAMAFGQLTLRVGLPDIETCLSVHATKLYHMDCGERALRSTLADANDTGGYRIQTELAPRVIAQIRPQALCGRGPWP
jgi:hypothetical protein